MVPEVGFNSDVDRLNCCFSPERSNVCAITTDIARKAIALFSEVEPDRVKNICMYLIEQLENVQACDRLYVAYSHQDFDAMKEILLQVYTVKESTLRNSIFSQVFSVMADDGNAEMMQFMVDAFPDIAFDVIED